MKKKVLPLMIAAIMAIGGLSITASAANTGTSTVDITKTLTATGLEDTVFNVTVEEKGYSDVSASVTSQPEIGDFSITVEKGETTGTYTIQLPEYESVGIYNYEIKETTGNVAGVTYSTATLWLVVTVTNDGNGGFARSAVVYLGSTSGDKNTQEFKNYYDSGTLNVSKSVTGNLGDKTKEFNVTVTFTKGNDVTINSTISYTDGTTTYYIEPSDWNGNTATATITVKDGSSVAFKNIPYGITYTVEEDDYTTVDGYTTTYDASNTGTLNSSEVTVAITNYKNNSAATGVILDSLPYILILAVVLIGVVYLVLRRRTSDRY
ncbi:MAG: DUF5979 domain-containing protein [Lachnospiraceae bacterium]|nr:DUF5979 domain-containing protein [Lachnospiraceae bacterium]